MLGGQKSGNSSPRLGMFLLASIMFSTFTIFAQVNSKSDNIGSEGGEWKGQIEYRNMAKGDLQIPRLF